MQVKTLNQKARKEGDVLIVEETTERTLSKTDLLNMRTNYENSMRACVEQNKRILQEYTRLQEELEKVNQLLAQFDEEIPQSIG